MLRYPTFCQRIRQPLGSAPRTAPIIIRLFFGVPLYQVGVRRRAPSPGRFPVPSLPGALSSRPIVLVYRAPEAAERRLGVVPGLARPRERVGEPREPRAASGRFLGAAWRRRRPRLGPRRSSFTAMSRLPRAASRRHDHLYPHFFVVEAYRGDRPVPPRDSPHSSLLSRRSHPARTLRYCAPRSFLAPPASRDEE